MTTAVLTRADYDAAFEAERQVEYPIVDAFEQRCGFAVDRQRLEAAARVLACPVKKNAANWQHGRVLYAAVRRYIHEQSWSSVPSILDIGTAKGFSALCMLWAIVDEQAVANVVSVDVIDPLGTQRRNTVAELEGLVTLRDILKAWPEAMEIDFRHCTGIDYLEKTKGRIHVAFIDGKHSGSVVRREGVLLAKRQEAGDLAIFDDLQIPDVSQAVTSLHQEYRLEYLDVLATRKYAIGVRR